MIENLKCPKCGGPMQSRANKSTGQRFWGCKKFPTCKGTLNTDGEPNRSRAEDEQRGYDEGELRLPSDDWRNRDRRRW